MVSIAHTSIYSLSSSSAVSGWRLEEEENLEFIDAGQVVDDVLEDVMDMISAMEVQRNIVS
jgi:hypothetical protein